MTLKSRIIWYGLELPLRTAFLGPLALLVLAGEKARSVVDWADRILPTVRD